MGKTYLRERKFFEIDYAQFCVSMFMDSRDMFKSHSKVLMDSTYNIVHGFHVQANAMEFFMAQVLLRILQ